MPDNATPRSNAAHVTAVFSDGWEHFDLPEGATLVELVRRLRAVSPSHRGSPVAIKVQIEDAGGPWSGEAV